MLQLATRIDLMARLGDFLKSDNIELQEVKETAFRNNPWFLPRYINLAINNIVEKFLNPELLRDWTNPYPTFTTGNKRSTIGLVMAGNLPLVGFHDFLSVFLSGCRVKIKPATKDQTLWNFIFKKLKEWDADFEKYVQKTEDIRHCDAYIATGSNNSSRYFDYYFAKYPHIIRKNRSSLAVLTGHESSEELDRLAKDICEYFGMGCRNVTQLLIPKGYDFQPLISHLEAFNAHLAEPKYKNNYDYQLALVLLNKIKYIEAGPVILVASDSVFSPLSVVHYQEYENTDWEDFLPMEDELQCVVGGTLVKSEKYPILPFGNTQSPELTDYADGINVLEFLNNLD